MRQIEKIKNYIKNTINHTYADSESVIKIEEDKESINSEKRELKEIQSIYKDFDRDHVWAFVSGHTSQAFIGNPKYLFVYINRYRPDIQAYWFCKDEETLAQVRKLGFRAFAENSLPMQYAINHTGVIVAEQVKFAMPEGFYNVKYINLWHGVGFKVVERKLYFGDISMNLARKYIERGSFYRNHQLMNATSEVIEQELAEDCGIESDMFIRTGYPRCLYQKYYDPIVSYNHDLRGQKGLPDHTKLAVYAPTFRPTLGGTFSAAITDLESLHEVCKNNNILLIFKVHPAMESEAGFLNAKKVYGELPYFWFWDNYNDFYEIMDQVELAIVDYTSLISDMVAVGIKHYIRYVFDYDEYMQAYSEHNNYQKMSTGLMCYSFEELLSAIETFEDRDESDSLQELTEYLWSYSQGKDDFDRIIQMVFDFKVKKKSLPVLYSFDVFDTLLSRNVLMPEGIFYLVQERIIEFGGFPFDLQHNYPQIRMAAEQNVREYYRKSLDLRNTERIEITFEEIFLRISEVYSLCQEQRELLAKWELEAELENVIPLVPQIQRLKQLITEGNQVVLISDMYLPNHVIKEMLKKADPFLAELPLYLSSDYGVQKISQKLFFEVYKGFEPFYDFEKWIHYGDNANADQYQPRRFKICTRRISKPLFNDYQNELIKMVGTYDSYLVAALQARMRMESLTNDDDFVISYIALCFVPYIDWVLRDAEKRGYKTLYFVSRDGHHLKRIADAIIEARGLRLKTKYIYASRRTWRVPSFINEIDDGFWQGYGSFTDIVSKEKLFRAMELNEETFRKFFPSIDPDDINFLDLAEMEDLKTIFKASDEYTQYLLETAKSRRELVGDYLLQQIDPSEKYAFVEYNGRGYTQDCMVRLWRHLIKNPEEEVPYYYSRSILPNMNGAIRHDFTTQNGRQYFLEAIFANMPYKSIEEYKRTDGVVEPIIVSIPYDKKMFEAMERILPEFARRYASLGLLHAEATDRSMYDFIHKYYSNNLENIEFANRIGSLMDSVTLYGKKRQYAPPYTLKLLDMFKNKELRRDSTKVTWSMSMSAVRSNQAVLDKYKEMYQILPGEKLYEGRLLNDYEIAENQKYKSKLERLEIEAQEWADLYSQAERENAVKNLVVFAVNGSKVTSQVLKQVKNELKCHEDFSILDCCIGNMTSADKKAEMIGFLARAKYIVLNQAIGVFSKIVFREDTTVMLLRSDPFNLYRQAANVNYGLKWRKKYVQLAEVNDIDVLQIPSPEQKERFIANFCPNSVVNSTLAGSCITDIYFKNNRENLRADLEKIFPEATGKKVILYMPTIKQRNDCKYWADILDLEYLKKHLENDYVVICNYNRNQVKSNYINLKEISGFSKLITEKQMGLRKLMIAADIIVGDYRDTFFESALLQKPVFSTAHAYEEMMMNSGVFISEFEDLIFAPVIKDAVELVDQISNIDQYDYTLMEQFKEKMFGGCDGKSTQRVVEYMIQKK